MAAVLSWWLAPGSLIGIGVMDDSLTSEVALTRRVALAEVGLARLALAAAAAGLLAAAVFWPRVLASGAYMRLMRGGPVPPAGYEAYLRRPVTVEAAVLLAALLAMLVYIRFGAAVFSQQALGAINSEDGVLEWASALMLLAAALVSAGIARRIGRGHPRFAMHVALAVLYFMMFGEEISWGQRLLGFGTPEPLQRVNVQAETNLHNMFGYLFDHLFIAGFLVWAALVPLFYHSLPPVRQGLLRIGLPVPSIGLAVVMTGVGVMLAPVVCRFLDPLPALRLAEARETLSALAFLLLMCEVSRHFPQTRSGAER